MTTERRCKDCPVDSTRLARFPGPRCATHHRAKKKADKARRHESYVTATYGLRPGEYAMLYDYQDGLCYICERATGAARKLSVDHDHGLEATKGTRASIRGLLCRPCNDMLGHCRDDIDMLERAIVYLLHPPAREVLDED